MDPSTQDSSSSAPSPTDTRRAQPSQTESQQSTDTVRRRPDANYGSIQTSTAASISGSQYLADPYERSGSRASVQPARSPLLGPERGRQRPKKPAMLRRTSSHAPHKGEIFSTEDDPDELQNDAAGTRQTYAAAPAYNTDSVRPNASIRRRSAAAPTLSRVQSSRSDGPEDDRIEEQSEDDDPMTASQRLGESMEDEQASDVDPAEDEDEDGDISDAESFTLKDRQQAINETHPFGIRIWKPALYKKDRSVQKTAEGDIHSSPGGHVSKWLLFFNLIWTLAFGWWMALFAAVGALACFLCGAAPSGRAYGRVLWGLSTYLFYPFGKYVRLETDEAYLDEDQGEGRSISEYEQWQSGDLEYGRLFFGPDGNRSIIGRSRRSIDSEPSETESLLGRSYRNDFSDNEMTSRNKRRLFGRGQWNIGRVIFFVVFYGLLTPSLFITSGICWLLVFWIPMGKVTLLLFDHLRRHPLALSFESDISLARNSDGAHSAILVCTYRATGWKYWKYTVDGTNIFLINLMAVVMFVIFDWLVLDGVLHIESFMTSPGFLFIAGLLSIIPLAYFIGQAVASISAQSSMGVGATVNAFFGTVVEVFLYCVALRQGKGQLVEGSIIGSIFAGVLFMPGLSMCFGAIKRKTQRFNSRSAGITSTMLLFAVIAAFGPTLFYQIYGTHELRCGSCTDYIDPPSGSDERECRRCYYSQVPALDDRFYNEAVRPFCYIAAVLLFSSYMIGLMFTLRTHAAIIWNADSDEKRQEEPSHPVTRISEARSAADATGSDIRDTNLFKRIYAQTSKQVGLAGSEERRHSRRASLSTPVAPNGPLTTPHMVPPKGHETDTDTVRSHTHFPGFTDADTAVVRGVTELAATAAAIAARDVRTPRRTAAHHGGSVVKKPSHLHDGDDGHDGQGEAGHGGHDAPNWSRTKSSVILLGATILYAVIAELLVDTVDVVLDNYPIDPKFLGITLFALVPNTTEFLNAISFAIHGNVALSMEIGSAYALQVCLLQIPALVLFSAVFPITPTAEDPDPAHWTFSLLFPQWDLVTVILCVSLLSYTLNEGKSNYFKGSILLLAYLVVIVGFYFSSFTDGSMDMGMSRFDTLDASGQWTSYKTIGRGTGGQAYQV
ncbi:Ca2+ transporter [Microdochium trichocladiopsis]|uniref:Ca2+ transporter n=1 Tax=Microdochium trichocladiopsis TaxID=1682393 RepID=A0A9P8YI25_9PEZI|nr:Ca2+ transporter [Microdochium trichocladiopsis]KAH7040338.1 Ca2+ transporter [Microdochium trichocladiopsis]